MRTRKSSRRVSQFFALAARQCAMVATLAASQALPFAYADGLELVGDTLVKTGSGTAEVSASEIGSHSVRVEGGTLRIAQAAKTSARYIRFRAKAPNPWHTQNAGVLWEMNSFQLVNGGSLVDYPSGTTVANLGTVSQESTPSNILTWDRSQNGDWLVRSSDPGFVIDMGGNVAFDGYAIAGAVISVGRSPYAFDVEVGVDDGAGGVDWALFDSRSQFCTAGYGADWFTSANGYAPRMQPVYAENPLPVFVAGATVTVAAGATLELSGVSGRIPNLSGSGRVLLASARPELTGDCTFTGSFDGVGALSLAMDGETVSAFSFDTTAIPVYNSVKARSYTVTGSASAAKLPIVFDSESAPLDLTLAGAVETPKTPLLRDRFGNEVAFTRHGLTTYRDATVTFLDSAPVVAKHVRFTPIAGVTQTAGINFGLDGTPVAFSDIQIAWMDAFRTTNYTSGVLSDQSAQSLIKSTHTGDKSYANLFDREPSTYHQYNRPSSTFGNDVALDSTPSLTVSFATAKEFDAFKLWQPTYEICNNLAYWIAQWRIETSLDGNVWMIVSDQSSEKVPTSRLYTGWPPVVTTPVDSGAIPRSGEWFKADAFEVDGDLSITGEPRYLRMVVTELSGSGGNGVGTFLSFGEIQIHKAGSWLAWPAGTTAAWTHADGSHGPATGSPGSLVDSTGAFTTNAWNNYAANQELDGASEAQWNVGSTEMVASGVGFKIETGSVLDFDSYAIYMGGQWGANNRCPTAWTLEVSYDDASWTAIDTVSGFSWDALPSNWRYMRDHWYTTRSVDWSGLGRYASDRFPDDAGLSVADGGTLSISNATETVGALYGGGTISLSDAILTVSGGDSRFSGTIVGADGVLVIDGGTFVAERADFSKLSKIRLVNGAVLSGRAKYRSALVFEVEAGCENLLRSYSSGTTIFVR